MKDRPHIINAERLKISVSAYLVLEFMHFNDTHLNYYTPIGLSYIGLSEKLFRHIVTKVLLENKYIRIIKSGKRGDFTITAYAKKRMDKMVGNKKDIESLFENQFMAIYPNKTGKKAALSSFMKLPFNDASNVVQDIIDAIEKKLKWIEKAPPKSFIPEWPMPSTYLNGERWKDELIPWKEIPEEEENSITFKPRNRK